MKYYLGIDPGMSGGIALLDGGGNCLMLSKMPITEQDIFSEIAETKDRSTLRSRKSPTPIFCIIEKVHSMPGQGVASTFKFGKGYGGLRMALIACGIPFDEVTPQKWQKAFGMGKNKTESKTQWKNRLKSKAQQLFPSEKVTLATADALLIAEYCRRREEGLL